DQCRGGGNGCWRLGPITGARFAGRPRFNHNEGGRLSSTSGALISVNGGTGTITIDSPEALTPGLVGGRPVLASVTNNGAFAADVDLDLTNASGVAGDMEVTGAGNVLNASFTQSDWTGDFSG